MAVGGTTSGPPGSSACPPCAAVGRNQRAIIIGWCRAVLSRPVFAGQCLRPVFAARCTGTPCTGARRFLRLRRARSRRERAVALGLAVPVRRPGAGSTVGKLSADLVPRGIGQLRQPILDLGGDLVPGRSGQPRSLCLGGPSRLLHGRAVGRPASQLHKLLIPLPACPCADDKTNGEASEKRDSEPHVAPSLSRVNLRRLDFPMMPRQTLVTPREIPAAAVPGTVVPRCHTARREDRRACATL